MDAVYMSTRHLVWTSQWNLEGMDLSFGSGFSSDYGSTVVEDSTATAAVLDARCKPPATVLMKRLSYSLVSLIVIAVGLLKWSS